MQVPSTVKNILFIDIETVPCVIDYEKLSATQKLLWGKKATLLGAMGQQEICDLFSERAAIYAEFGKVIAIALGYITFDVCGETLLHVQNISSHNEAELLEQLRNILEEKHQQENIRLCAHNGKEFDFPYLCRRMLINGISLPTVLDLSGKKPWEITHIDTMEMWRFGDRKSFISLDLLANLFGIDSSKTVMDGSQVSHFYYIKNDLTSIANYCMQDVIVACQIFLKLNNWQTIKETNIIFA
jgi:predicted PolB exonuclease-like 3'-5' exonuclease